VGILCHNTFADLRHRFVLLLTIRTNLEATHDGDPIRNNPAGGNTAFATAARLTLKGFEVTLFELPEFASALEPIMESHVINLEGVLENGPARIHGVTTDAEEALAASDLALLIVPAMLTKPLPRRALHIFESIIPSC